MLLPANDLPDLFETYWNEEIIRQGTADLSVSEIQEHMPTYWRALSTFAGASGLDLQAVDALHKKENAYLISYGIDGTHWTLGANNRPQWTPEFAEDDARSGLGLGVLARATPLGIGIFALLGDPDWIDAERVSYLNEVRFNPNGILGKNNVCVLTQSFVTALDGGTDLRAVNRDFMNDAWTLFGQVITGVQPVSAYQDWIDRYNSGPGPAIERAATRDWAHLVSECPSS